MRIDLQRGVVPISAIGKQIARLLKRATATNEPIIITQRGYPTGAIISLELLERLQEATTTEEAHHDD